MNVTAILATAAFLGMPVWMQMVTGLKQCNSIVTIGTFMLICSVLMSIFEAAKER